MILSVLEGNIRIMAHILSFSDEVLCCVFESITNIRDLHNVMRTCHQFLRVVKYHNNLWKLDVKVKNVLHSLSSRCFPLGEVPLTKIDNINSDKYPECNGVEGVLQDYVFSGKLTENMTTRFYASKVLTSLRYRKIEKKFQELKVLPESKKSLLEGAVLICQWTQTEEATPICLTSVEKKLDDITNRVKKVLGDKYNNLNPPNVTTGTAREVLNCINQVLYDEMGFKVNQSICKLEYVFIDKVLESRTGFPVTLCIIYREVAIRMGIYCEPVLALDTGPNFLSHSFLLKWYKYFNEIAAESLIDAANGGAMRHHDPASYPVSSAKEFLLRMANYVRFIKLQSIRAGRREDGSSRTLCQLRRRNELMFSRLTFALSTEQTIPAFLYAHLCLDLEVQLEDAIQVLQQVGNFDYRLMEKCVSKLEEQQAAMRKRYIRFRLPFVKYAVGLVVVYQSHNYQSPAFCVIHSWTDGGRSEKPCYNVLVDGGESLLVPEGNLSLQTTVSSSTINHPKIGLHFKRFDGRRYVPNAELMATYPEDEAFIISLLG